MEALVELHHLWEYPLRVEIPVEMRPEAELPVLAELETEMVRMGLIIEIMREIILMSKERMARLEQKQV